MESSTTKKCYNRTEKEKTRDVSHVRTCHIVRNSSSIKKNAHLFEQRTKEPRSVTNTAKRCFYVHKVAFVCPKCMVHGGPCSNSRGETLFALPIKVVFIRVGPATLVILKCTPSR